MLSLFTPSLLLLDIQDRVVNVVAVRRQTAGDVLRCWRVDPDDQAVFDDAAAAMFDWLGSSAVDIAISVPDDWLVYQEMASDTTANRADLLAFVALERGHYFPALAQALWVDVMLSHDGDDAGCVVAIEQERLNFLDKLIRAKGVTLVLVEPRQQSLARVSQVCSDQVLTASMLARVLGHPVQGENNETAVALSQVCGGLLLWFSAGDLPESPAINLSDWHVIRKKRWRKKQFKQGLIAALVCVTLYLFLLGGVYFWLHHQRQLYRPLQLSVRQLEHEFNALRSLSKTKKQLLERARTIQRAFAKRLPFQCVLSHVLSDHSVVDAVERIQLAERLVTIGGRSMSYQQADQWVGDLVQQCGVVQAQSVELVRQSAGEDGAKLFSVVLAV